MTTISPKKGQNVWVCRGVWRDSIPRSCIQCFNELEQDCFNRGLLDIPAPTDAIFFVPYYWVSQACTHPSSPIYGRTLVMSAWEK